MWRNAEGNIAMITALTLVPLMGMVGGAIDIVRATGASAQLSSALDAAALAAANLNNSADTESVIQDYVSANLSGRNSYAQDLSVSVDANVALNSKTVVIRAEAHVETVFLGLFGVANVPITAEVTAVQSVTNVELALVMDVSASMKGVKFTNLKSAASSFIDEMLDGETANYTSLSLVPFGGTVNIGPTLFDAYAVSIDDDDTILDPKTSDYDRGKRVVDDHFRFSTGDHCIEYRSEDFDDQQIPAQSRGQVPHFWRWNNFAAWCPRSASATLFNSNNAQALKDHVQGMVLSDGTGMDVGALWGLKALSPVFAGALGGDFDARPAAYGAETLKVMVVMTDGAITQQNRPRDINILNVHKNRPNNNDPDSGTIRGNQGDRRNMQTVVSGGNANSKSHQDNASAYFKRTCDAAKANGIVVYSIGFRISKNSTPEKLLKYCASDVSKYYLVESLDIQSAFDSIASSVNALRFVG
ncbi:MAG: pilus assembly protein TadG-related protein [Pseudomonadota bacterium]